MFSAARRNGRVSKGGNAVRLLNEPLQVVQRQADLIVLKNSSNCSRRSREVTATPSGEATRASRDSPGTSFADFLLYVAPCDTSCFREAAGPWPKFGKSRGTS
jgi:hypothetical protein